MPDKIQSNRIICEGGLDTTRNWLNLSINKPGAASYLINYEVGLTGGYRRINGYQYYDTAFPEVGVGTSTGKVLGLALFPNTTTGLLEIIAARKLTASNEYEFYLYTSGLGWVLIATGLTKLYTSGAYTVNKLRYAIVNDGTKNTICFVDGVNNATLYNGTTWSEIKSSNGGTSFADAGGNQALNAPDLVGSFFNTLFVGHDLKNNAGGVIAFSSPNSAFDFLVANGAGQLVIGFEVKQFKPFREELYIFGINGIKKAVADVTSGFLVKDVTGNIGLVGIDTVIEIGGDLIFLAPDGFRPVAGTDKIGDVQLETISKPIQDLLYRRLIFDTNVEDYNIVAIRGKSQFRMFFNNSSFGVTDSRGILGQLRTADTQNGWEYSELLGFRTSVVDSRYYGSTEYILHGDYDGCVYRQETGNDLNGTPIYAVYQTPYLDMGDTEVRKLAQTLNLFLLGEGTLEITLGLTYDWGSAAVSNPADYIYNVTSESIPYYDEGFLYDSGVVYGGNLQPVVAKNFQGSFFSVRASFVSYGSDYPYTIHGMIFEYAVEGRR